VPKIGPFAKAARGPRKTRFPTSHSGALGFRPAAYSPSDRAAGFPFLPALRSVQAGDPPPALRPSAFKAGLGPSGDDPLAQDARCSSPGALGPAFPPSSALCCRSCGCVPYCAPLTLRDLCFFCCWGPAAPCHQGNPSAKGGKRRPCCRFAPARTKLARFPACDGQTPLICAGLVGLHGNPQAREGRWRSRTRS
jgi:hypothetical protein